MNDHCDDCESKCQYMEIVTEDDYTLCCKCNNDIPEDEYCSDCFSDIASHAYDMIKGELERG